MVQWFMNRRSKMKKLIAVLLLVGSSTAMAYDNYMGQIIGGVAGGILGNQIGGGSGQVVTTAIGASVGAIVGGRVQENMNNNRYGYSSYENYDYERSRRYNHPRIIYQQPQVQYQSCTAWTETADQYGNITRTRTCY
jgi:uncharacterized protein YcfJ